MAGMCSSPSTTTTPNALCAAKKGAKPARGVCAVVAVGVGGGGKVRSDKHHEDGEEKERPAVVLVAKGVVGAEHGRRVHLDGAVVPALAPAVALVVARDAKVVCLDGKVLEAQAVLAARKHRRREAAWQRRVAAVCLDHADLGLGCPLKLDVLVRPHPVVLRVQRRCVAEREALDLARVPLQERRRLLARLCCV